jgi:hypothetical protein
MSLKMAAKLKPCVHQACGAQLSTSVDVCVAALCLDTVEMCSALSITSRFFVRGPADADRVGCIICHAPTTAYHLSQAELQATHMQHRTREETRTLRAVASPEELLKAGKRQRPAAALFYMIFNQYRDMQCHGN